MVVECLIRQLPGELIRNQLVESLQTRPPGRSADVDDQACCARFGAVSHDALWSPSGRDTFLEDLGILVSGLSLDSSNFVTVLVHWLYNPLSTTWSVN